MNAIIERLRNATEASMELDFWISARAWDPSHHTDEELQADIDLVGIDGMVIDKPFTSSVDAALALVDRMLPGLHHHTLYSAYVSGFGTNVPHRFGMVCHKRNIQAFGVGATPALAILIALFTALQDEDKP